ncbi:amidohydrolase [Mycolicibacterium holsaticum]|uniref:amidohydrolase n=1 Tax=Mycolicibacterium holsaticum TaxID=152142 RepID=UPI001C7DCE60|nr:amidohydrolase [Mycolicibacterium holsaticum]MDA4107871.1 amidohydrolase [Mycolicibacterium holsaticum DSM 44478 = JCM 12374]QZA14694.1 amidohydrolase [Mycolicibacterium holsaticum DSM 44478 = JCM 12374]UNC07862.1 amidohydrolase [Mycolicibacterium holsaticum DSM 44478 = JCM 12374]
MTQLLLNGRVHSPAMPDATALAVRDGVVAWVGSDDVGRAQFPDAQISDLDGAFVAPAFVDSHVHLTATGLTLIGLDLRAATSLRHCLHLLGEHTRAHPDGVIWAHGWDESGWPERTPPSTADVDAAVGDRPAYLARVDVHSAAASTALRALAAGLPDAGGYAPQHPLTGDAHHLVRAVARDRLTPGQRHQARAAALDAAAALGIVAVHECAGPEIGGFDDWDEIRRIEHGVDVVGYWGEAVGDAREARALIDRTGAHGLAGDLFVDGALGSRTAWLQQPYSDAQNCCGNTYLDTEAIAAHLHACTEAGITAGFHVIGDAAVSAVVDALERVVDTFGAPAVARCGHRLEHLEMITDEQARRLGGWGVFASVQPNFDALWGGADGMYAQRLGPDRGKTLNPFALLASQGVPLAFGSDTPVTSMNPWETVRAAIQHRTRGSALSARAAFSAATRGAWRAAGVRDGITGTLVPGAPASYAVWETGELEVHAPEDAVQRWSTDQRSRVPALPRLDGELPHCRQTVNRGVVLHG